VDQIPLAQLAGLEVDRIPLALLAGLDVDRIPLALSAGLADAATASGCCDSRSATTRRRVIARQLGWMVAWMIRCKAPYHPDQFVPTQLVHHRTWWETSDINHSYFVGHAKCRHCEAYFAEAIPYITDREIAAIKIASQKALAMTDQRKEYSHGTKNGQTPQAQ